MKCTFYKHLFCPFVALLFKPSAILLDHYFVVQHGCVCPETPRQATQLDCLPRMLQGIRTNRVKKCAVRKIIFCTGLTRAAKAGQKSILQA
jgi:hypothetical protein